MKSNFDNRTLKKLIRYSEESEKDIEKRLVREVTHRGGLCLKYSNPADRGYPDRLCVMPKGITFWVELKSKGRKPTKLQQSRIAHLRDLGQSVNVIDSAAEMDDLLKQYDDLTQI